MPKPHRLLIATALILGSVGIAATTDTTPALAAPASTANYPYRVQQEAYSHNGLQYGKFSVRVDDRQATTIQVWTGVEELSYHWFLAWYPNTYRVAFSADVVLLRNGELFGNARVEDTQYGATSLGTNTTFNTYGLPGVYEIVVTPKALGQYWGGSGEQVESDLYPTTETIKIAIANR